MTCIINPMWFYWIHVAECLKTASCVLAVMALIFTASSGVVYWLCEKDSDVEAVKKMFVVSLVCAVVFGIPAMFIPSKNTLIEMKIAGITTKENIGWTVEQIKSVVDYIVEAMQKVK